MRKPIFDLGVGPDQLTVVVDDSGMVGFQHLREVRSDDNVVTFSTLGSVWLTAGTALELSRAIEEAVNA